MSYEWETLGTEALNWLPLWTNQKSRKCISPNHSWNGKDFEMVSGGRSIKKQEKDPRTRTTQHDASFETKISFACQIRPALVSAYHRPMLFNFFSSIFFFVLIQFSFHFVIKMNEWFYPPLTKMICRQFTAGVSRHTARKSEVWRLV